MDKDVKARGLKHHTNKKKYNKKKPPAQVPPPRPKKLDSNWDRYEQKETEQNISSSTDFAVLAKAPISYGSHFQFKSDKLETLEPAAAPNLFNLDLVLLEKSLSTIPFYVRSGIGEDYFSESQQKLMNALDDKINDYQSYLKSYQSNEPDTIFGSKSETSESEDESENVDEMIAQKITPKKEAVSEKPKQNEPTEDLEQWLDDILDD